jgi:hypothetical protein
MNCLSLEKLTLLVNNPVVSLPFEKFTTGNLQLADVNAQIAYCPLQTEICPLKHPFQTLPN